MTDGVWCLVANMDDRGMRRFVPGTKIYCYPPLWGDGYENIQVIGRNRHCAWMARVIVQSKRLRNWRAKVVYHPYIVANLAGQWTREQAEHYAAMMNERIRQVTP